jgi:hypothetical protein
MMCTKVLARSGCERGLKRVTVGSAIDVGGDEEGIGDFRRRLQGGPGVRAN